MSSSSRIALGPWTAIVASVMSLGVVAFAQRAEAQTAIVVVPPGEQTSRGAAPLVIRAQGAPQTIAVPSSTEWSIGVNGLPSRPMREVCRTPCTLFVPPGRFALELRGESGASMHVVDVSPGGTEIVARTATMFRVGLGIALGGVALDAAGLALLITGNELASGTCGSVPGACDVATVGEVGIVVGLIGIVAGIVPLVVGYRDRITSHPIGSRGAARVQFDGASLRF